MKKERLKGFLIAKLNNYGAHDKDSFIEKSSSHLEPVKLEADIEECVDELIEEGWFKYNEKGHNITQTLPESEKEQKTLNEEEE